MLDIINKLILNINLLLCSVKNIQKYVGVVTSTDDYTLTGRIARLEQLMDSEGVLLPSALPVTVFTGSSWNTVTEWADSRNDVIYDIKEW